MAAFVALADGKKIKLRAADVADLLEVVDAVMAIVPDARSRSLMACSVCAQACCEESKCACCRRAHARFGTDPLNPHHPMVTAKGYPVTYLFFSVAVKAQAA